MIEVCKITSNIYNTKVTEFFTYRDHTLTSASQVIRHNFF